MQFKEVLAKEALGLGPLSGLQLDQFEQHYLLLMRWNKTLNLTRILDLYDVVRFHYCESLFLARTLPPGPLRIVDVGSGAGFPGIPIAIARPECEVDLVESHRRKCVFLAEASRKLANVRVRAERAEHCPPNYDWTVSRAVRLADVLKLRLSDHIAILLGLADVKAVPPDFRFVDLPWGERRLLALGTVPRETSART